MKIRQIGMDERATLVRPLPMYAFMPSPAADRDMARMGENARYHAESLTLAVEDEPGIPGAAACGSAIPMRQNVRGVVYPMAGIAGVASHPLARRRGYVRALLTELLGQVRESGQVVSALYPFRPSFYERLGYIGLPQTRTATFSPADLSPFLSRSLPGELTLERIAAGYETFRAFTDRLLLDRHGFAAFPESRAVWLRDADERWLVTARVDGEVVAAATYHIAEHAGDLIADRLLTTSALGRALLLQFFARHVDQVARVVATVAADELPELWATDLAVATQGKSAFPDSPAPMARVLSVERLAGMPVGQAAVTVEVVDDPFIAGTYVLDGTTGALVVGRDAQRPANARLTAAGLSGLVYGVLAPDDVVVRALGTIEPAAAEALRTMFPRQLPYLSVGF